MTRLPAPSYYDHAATLQADRCVIYGPHFDVQDLADPFKVARRFAHAIAQETGEPFAWGWYDHPAGLRPAVCALESAPLFMRVEGATSDRQACAKVAG